MQDYLIVRALEYHAIADRLDLPTSFGNRLARTFTVGIADDDGSLFWEKLPGEDAHTDIRILAKRYSDIAAEIPRADAFSEIQKPFLLGLHREDGIVARSNLIHALKLTGRSIRNIGWSRLKGNGEQGRPHKCGGFAGHIQTVFP